MFWYQKMMPFRAGPSTYVLFNGRQDHYSTLPIQIMEEINWRESQKIYQKLKTNVLVTRLWPLLEAPPASPTHATA